MEKIKEKLHMGGHKEHHKEHETFASEHMPKQYETRTETVEKIPEMRKEHHTDYVPKMHERTEQVEVPVHKVVMEKQTRTVPEMRKEPVEREVAVPTGDYKERVVDHNRHPGYVDTGVDQMRHEHRQHHMGTGTGTTTGLGSEHYGTDRHMGTHTTGTHTTGTGMGTGVGSGQDTHQRNTNEDAYSNLHGQEHKSTMQKVKEAVMPSSKKAEY